MQADPAGVATRDEKLLRILLPVSVFVSGAVVMVLEVLCTRLIAPVYGTSLHVWSAIIAVTLLSLSVGYWVGGRVADRFPHASTYFVVFEIAALLIVVLPLLHEPVLLATKPLGLRGGALAAAVLFLGLPLTLLGTISPYAVRLAAHLIVDLGRTTGRLYALSTAGSLFGTLCAGFYLIPSFRLRTLFVGTALVLILPAVVWQAIAARRRLTSSPASPTTKDGPGTVFHLTVAAFVVLASGLVAARPLRTAPGVKHVTDTHFAQLKVLDAGGARTLLANNTIQTQAIAGTSVALAAYIPVMAELAWRAKPEGRRALLIGLGGGVLPPLFAAWGVRMHSAEVDQEVVDVARDWFAFDPRRYTVTVGDGRQLLASSPETWDYVVLDAFAGEAVPIHLLTEEMVALIDQRLAKHGLLVLNYLGYRDGEHARPLRSVVRTIETRFPHVAVYPSFPPGDYGNNIVLASHEPIRLRRGPRPFPIPPWMEPQVALQDPIDTGGSAIVLSDDYNPLDLWAVDASETWRKAAMEMWPRDVLFAE